MSKLGRILLKSHPLPTDVSVVNTKKIESFKRSGI